MVILNIKYMHYCFSLRRGRFFD